jgi:hypothetical protein
MKGAEGGWEMDGGDHDGGGRNARWNRPEIEIGERRELS